MDKNKVSPGPSLLSGVSLRSSSIIYRRKWNFLGLFQVVSSAITIIMLFIVIILMVGQDKQETGSLAKLPESGNLIYYSIYNSSNLLPKKHKKLSAARITHVGQINASLKITKMLWYISAADMLKSIDSTKNPCDDFYEFSCQKWMDDHALDRSAATKIHLSVEKKSARVDELLMRPLKDDAPEHEIKLWKLYNSCVNKTQRNLIGNSYLMKDLEELGGFPSVVGESWDDSSFDFIIYGSVGGKSRKTMMKGLTDPVIEDYYNILVKIATTLGARSEVAKKDMLEVIGFEIFLANISQDIRYAFSDTNNFTINLGDLVENAPGIDWKRLLEGLFFKNEPLTNDFQFQVFSQDFFVKLADKISIMDKRILANYLIVRSVLAVSDTLGDDMLKIEYVYLTGVLKKQKYHIYEYCKKIVEKFMHISISNMYVKRHFSVESKVAISEIVQRIRKSFEHTLSNIQWMDDETRKAAQLKMAAKPPNSHKSVTTHPNVLKSMYASVAFEDEIVMDSVIDDYYKELDIDEENFYRNYINCYHFAKKLTLDYFESPPFKYEWTTFGKVYVSNAYHIPAINAIRKAQYEHMEDSIGTTVKSQNLIALLALQVVKVVKTHRIHMEFPYIHVFNKGSEFDHEGNLREWWQNKTSTQFEEKIDCLRKQYDNETIHGVQVNGTITLGENIADNGGVKHAYLAYNEWKKHYGDEPSLPGLPYNSNQMFWLSYSTARCAEYHKEYVESSIVSRRHSLYPLRVNIPLSNIPYFAKDFNCPLGSGMNPKKKCLVW
ncbi:Neprilysin-2 [Nymphon striatum]|nr:Neprilysin-2 [Nymphon striatum]